MATEKDASVTIHESIHALREYDIARPTKLKHVRYYRGRDKDLEESLTEAETITRENPFRKAESGSGYYHYLPNKYSGESNAAKVTEDRVTLTDAKSNAAQDVAMSGKKGKRAEKKLLANYPKTRISHIRMSGDAEAIDTYYKLNDNDVVTGKQGKRELHIYMPHGNLKLEKLNEEALAKQGGKVEQWDDGKLHKVVVKKRPVAVAVNDKVIVMRKHRRK